MVWNRLFWSFSFRTTIKFLLTEEIGIDGDDPHHIKWIYSKSVDRANEFGIAGVTYRLTQGKNVGASYDAATFRRIRLSMLSNL